jgi:putative ABC transport system permease protein
MLAFDSWKPRFLALPGVRDATKANFLPGSKVIQVIAADFNGEPISQLDEVTVGYDYPEVMGMHFVAGRSFNPAYGQDSNGVVVNETAARRYHLYALVGKPWIENWIILGIVKDFNQRGFETATEPTAIRIETRHSNPTDHILLKVDGRRLPQTIAALNAMWTDIEPGFPLEYHFLDEQFNQMFLQYRQMDVVFMAFAGLTLFIALLGIFVLSAFLALQRSKEIGIRKVLGASVQGVIRLLNRDFLILVLLADVIALPVLWFLSQQWLQGFAYRIPLPWFAFAGTVLLTLGCTLATVSFQAWKAATADPVKALKYE